MYKAKMFFVLNYGRRQVKNDVVPRNDFRANHIIFFLSRILHVERRLSL